MLSEVVLDLVAFNDWTYAMVYIDLLKTDLGDAARISANHLASKYADLDGLSNGVFYSTECREEHPFNDRARIEEGLRDYEELAGVEGLDWTGIFCAVWPVHRADPAENEAVSSAVPALLLVGEFDHITPPESARATHRQLWNSHLVEFPGTGHDVLSANHCGAVVLNEFLGRPDRQPSSPCALAPTGPAIR